MYTTVWSNPPLIASYKILPDQSVQHINSKEVASLSGYTACTEKHVFSVGGASGEVFAIDSNGGLGSLVQQLSFRNPHELSDGAKDVPHGNFGGLRHGSHSIDLGPDGSSAYVADIGHNCIWTYSLDESAARSPLTMKSKHISPRSGDGPRHTWPHPNGKVLYSLQEHSSMVDVFLIADNGTTLEHKHGVKIIPADKNPERYWADEVRLSRTNGDQPRYLYASTRGLEKQTMGYVAAFKLDENGMIVGEAIHVFETATSGGLANAVEPSPAFSGEDSEDFMALTDSEEGFVFILSFDGRCLREVARVQLKTDDGEVATAATAVWLT